MSVKFTIQDAQSKDISAIENLIEAGYRKDEARLGWTHETDILSGDRLSDGEIAKTLEDKNSKMFVAIDSNNHEVIGVICVTKDNDWIEFGKFSVRPNLQGSGIGRKLITHVENFVSEIWGEKKLKLSVISRRTELVDFYLRCGFIDTGHRIDFLKVHPYVILKKGVENLEVIIMEKSL